MFQVRTLNLLGNVQNLKIAGDDVSQIVTVMKTVVSHLDEVLGEVKFANHNFRTEMPFHPEKHINKYKKLSPIHEVITSCTAPWDPAKEPSIKIELVTVKGPVESFTFNKDGLEEVYGNLKRLTERFEKEIAPYSKCCGCGIDLKENEVYGEWDDLCVTCCHDNDDYTEVADPIIETAPQGLIHAFTSNDQMVGRLRVVDMDVAHAYLGNSFSYKKKG